VNATGDERGPSILLADLVDEQQDGTPAIILVSHYAEQESVAAGLAAECAIYDLEPDVEGSFAPMLTALDEGERPGDRVLIGCVRGDEVEAWAGALEARRERLPTRVALLIIVMLRHDLPTFARLAPGFMSWAKSNVIGSPEAGTKPANVDAATLARLREPDGSPRDVWADTTLCNLRTVVRLGGTSS
jgi:hypothetical protein